MGVPNFDLFRFIAESFEVKTFIETGSGHGETAAKAVDIFPSSYTIEFANKLYQEVNKKLSKVASCYHGKSVNVLKFILPQINGDPILYWLDAHWSQGPTAGKNEQCPLMGELEQINKRDGNNDFIFIDDAHIFFSPAVLKPPFDLAQWPDIIEIFKALEKKERYTFILTSWRCIEHGIPGGIVMPEDCIVSVPVYAKDQLYEWLLSLNLEN